LVVIGRVHERVATFDHSWAAHKRL
jgi:hypothetical protein